MEKITDEPGSEPKIRFGTQEIDAARAGNVLIELPTGDTWDGRKVTTCYVTDQAWAADLAVRAIERAEKLAAEAAKGGGEEAAKAKEDERERRRKARKAAETAHDKNLAVGRSLIAARGAKNRKENKAAWVEAIAAVVLRDNDNLPAAGLGLALESLQTQTVQYKTIKVSGEEQKMVTYATPEACRRYLWERITEARTADQKLELLAEALIAVEMVDPEAVPRSRRVFYWLGAGQEVAKILGKQVKAVRALARRK